MGKASPLDVLLPYQRKWADDDARFKIGLMARQTGKDFGAGAEGVRDCVAAEVEKRSESWIIGAPSERQALESLRKWQQWSEAFNLAIESIDQTRERPEALLTSATIQYPCGSRVVAVPGRPETVRGLSGHVLLTEFAFFENPDATWRAMYPTITSPFGGRKKLRIISTPNGLGNKYAELWHENYKAKGAKYSCHRVSLSDAVRQGLDVDEQELREGMGDPEGVAQEYDLEFLDAAAVLLPYDLIALCEGLEATTVCSLEWYQSQPQFPRFGGYDFARKRNLSVFYVCEEIGGLLMTKEIVEMARMSTPKQFDIVAPRIERMHRVSVDYTGPGVGIGDLLVKRFGEWNPAKDRFGKIELVTFTSAEKLKMFPRLKRRFEERKVIVPIDRALREDLHSVHRVVSKAGNITYRAPFTEDGHADRCVALALCSRAADYGAGSLILPKAFRTKAARAAASRRNREVLA